MNKLRAGAGKSSGTSARPTVISVMSGKGGVGKSVIAYNLAERTAHLGFRTLLVDADFSFGNLHVLANTNPADGLESFFSGKKDLAETAVSISGNLTLLGRSDSGPAEILTSGQSAATLAARLRTAAHRYDLIIIDHGSGVAPSAAVFAGASDTNLLVLAPELTSIADCYGLYKYLCQSDRAIESRLLFNRTESEDEAEYVWTRFSAMTEQFLGQTPGLAGALPEDPAVRQSVAGQKPVSQVSPEAPFVLALQNMIRSLGWEVSPQATPPQNREINIVTATADIRE